MARPPKRTDYGRSFHRKEGTREPYDLVLLVCEGEKTEPFYFRGLVKALGLSSVNVKIVSPPGSDPMSLVNAALEAMIRDEYDRVYCVFDRDQHENFDQAVDHIRRCREGKAGKLRATTSLPCFEVWILLHFVYSAKPFQHIQGQSISDSIIREIRVHYAGYAKAQRGVFDYLEARLDTALRNAAQLRAENIRTGASDPATDIHLLVQYLQQLKKPKT